MLTIHVRQAVLRRALATSLCFLPTLALAKIDTIQSGQQKTIKVQIDDVELRDVTIQGQAFVEAHLIGVDGHEGIIRSEEGKPQIPVVRFLVQGKPTVRVISSLTENPSLTSPFPLKPVQPSTPKIRGVERRFAFDQEAYEKDTMDPGKAFDIKPAGSIRGVQQTLVTLYPLAYAPAAQTYAVRKSFEISVEEPLTTETADIPERFLFVVGKAFENSPSLKAYGTLKRELGFVVDQVVVDQRTAAETIRNKIKEFYAKTDAKLAYVLIIGDVEDVQSKPSNIITGVTDHYYRSIDTNDYAQDINGPDIGVGRVSVRQESDLAAVLQKYTRYTLGSFSTNEWLNSLSFLATDDQWEVAEGTHNYVIETYTRGKGYMGAFPSTPQLGGDQLYAITHNVPEDKVRDALGHGRTVIDYSGHGANTYWDAPHFDQNDVRNLKDPNALPFVIANACITGDFRVRESFGETWQRHPFGAVTYWGSMDSTFWDEDDILERKMFDGIFKGDKRTFAEITHNAMTETWVYYGGEGFSEYYWETYVLFGDPSIQLRTTRVNNLTLQGPASVSRGTRQVTFTVQGDNGPLVGASVALSRIGTNVAQKVKTDLMGRATLDLGVLAREAQTVQVVASNHNTTVAKGLLQIK